LTRRVPQTPRVALADGRLDVVSTGGSDSANNGCGAFRGGATVREDEDDDDRATGALSPGACADSRGLSELRFHARRSTRRAGADAAP
jgi:hypothetical protein